MLQIDGIVPIIPTPFDVSEAIRWEELDALIDFAVAAGACAVCLPAYASEFYKLAEDERIELVARAVAAAAGRLPVIAQVNAPSLRLARKALEEALRAGADAVCSASPRAVPLGERDLFEYFDALLESVGVPFILQDYNPGGASLNVSSLAKLHERHPQFRYVKLEDPMLGGRVTAIREATGGSLKVLEGWGGMYTLELAPAGIAGVVPGLGLTDLLDRVFRLASAGQREEAEPCFEGILPQIVFSLQSLELFHHVEKRLLRARGILSSVAVRRPTLVLSRHDEQYIDYLNGRILRLLESQGMPADPRGRPAEARP